MIIIVIWSTVVWLSATFLTKQESDEKLRSFYKKVHPGGAGWKRIAEDMPEVEGDKGFGRLFFNWFAGSFMVMAALFGIGKIIFAEYLTGFVFIGISVLLGIVIWYNLSIVKLKE